MKIIYGDTELRQRNLPHLERPGASYFITWRLAGTIPSELLESLRFQTQALHGRSKDTTNNSEKRKQAADERKRIFEQFDRHLDSESTGPKWLTDPCMADIVCNVIKDQTAFASIDCFTVMSNHVHLLFTPIDPHTARDVLKRIKQITAFHCLKISHSIAPFWEGENYDHIVRENEWARILIYIIQNPVAAGLCKHWRDWPYTYLAEEFPGLPER
jgi:putative transposase